MAEDEFVARLPGGLGSYPRYFSRLAEMNQLGPPVVTEPAGLRPPRRRRRAAPARRRRASRRRPAGTRTRPRASARIGVDPAADCVRQLARLADRPRARRHHPRREPGPPDEILWQALKIGVDLAGELAGGMDAWIAADLPTASTRFLTAEQAADEHTHAKLTVFDIRQDAEFRAGHVPGAVHTELGALADADTAAAAPAGPVLVLCSHGERAMSAASLLQAVGRDDVAVLAGGSTDLAAASGRTLTRNGTDGG